MRVQRDEAREIGCGMTFEKDERRERRCACILGDGDMGKGIRGQE